MSRTPNLLRRTIGVLPLLFFLACRAPSGSSGLSNAPNFALKDLDGKTVRLEDFRGKAVLLDFWATWCEPCNVSIPHFEGLFEKYRSRGLEVVGLNQDSADEDVRGFIRAHKMRYANLLDPENSIEELYGVRGLPATFLIDERGRITNAWLGFDDEIAADIEGSIKRLLDEKKSGTTT